MQCSAAYGGFVPWLAMARARLFTPRIFSHPGGPTIEGGSRRNVGYVRHSGRLRSFPSDPWALQRFVVATSCSAKTSIPGMVSSKFPLLAGVPAPVEQSHQENRAHWPLLYKQLTAKLPQGLPKSPGECVSRTLPYHGLQRSQKSRQSHQEIAESASSEGGRPLFLRQS